LLEPGSIGLAHLLKRSRGLWRSGGISQFPSFRHASPKYACRGAECGHEEKLFLCVRGTVSNAHITVYAILQAKEPMMTANNTPGAAQPPENPREKAERYKVQIDKSVFETTEPTPTGRALLTLAGKIPPEQFALYEKPQGGGQPIRIALDKHVDLRKPGVERFVTLPLDQTEGRASRRQFSLPQEDLTWLDGLGLEYELVSDGGALRVVVYGMPLPEGYNVPKVDVNVRIEPGYPDAQIDMAYFFPGLTRIDGRSIAAVCDDSFDGKAWQRWSRHRTPANPWRPGIDNLATHFALIDSWLSRELKKA
jgi:hypothetical protein